MRHWKYRGAHWIAAGLILLLSGCGTAWPPTGTLRLTSETGARVYKQAFVQAYYAQNESGDTDICLVQEGILARSDDVPGKPIAPDSSVAPRQVVHIRMFWTPMNGVKADHPANTNASLHWCMMDADQGSLVEYTGSGLVQLSYTRSGAVVTIRKAWMKVSHQRGALVDPLGPSILEGTFQATSDPGHVSELMAEIKAVSAPMAAAPQTPPPIDP